MEQEQKPKRPRISGNRGTGRDGMSEKYEKVDYSQRERPAFDPEKRPPFDPERRPRPYSNDRPDYNNSRNSYGNQGNNRPYGNNRSYGNDSPDNAPHYGDRPVNRPYRSQQQGAGEQQPYNKPAYGNRYGNEGNERNYNTDRPYRENRPAYGNRPDNERRPYNNNSGERRPYGNSNNSGERRPYNNNSTGERRPYNNNNTGERRPYNNNRGGGGGYQQRDNRYGQPGGDSRPRPQQRHTGDYDPQAKYSERKRIEYNEANIDPNEPIRLNKYLANAGICSRREADEFILAGVVKVNGEVKKELGTKILRSDAVIFQEKEVKPEHRVYVLLNKPKDCVTTSDDPQGRLTVMDIVRSACSERIYPVGRLDRNTTGVLLLTNDGDLASKLTHPKFVKKKIYHVWTDRDVTEEDMQRIADGVELEDGPIHADAVSYATDTDKNQVGIEIHSGRNRIVRRIFEALGYRVVKLDRVYFAGLTKKNLPRGRWRYLTQIEVNMLNMGSFE